VHLNYNYTAVLSQIWLAAARNISGGGGGGGEFG